MSIVTATSVLAVCGSMIGLTTVAVGLRFYARKHQRLPFMTDDWATLAALTCFLAVSSLCIVLIRTSPLGRPDGTTHLTSTSYKIQFAVNLISKSTLVLTKLSILFFYRRVLTVRYARWHHDWFDIILLLTILVAILSYVAIQILSPLQCGSHVPDFWNPADIQSCDHFSVLLPFGFGFDLAFELWILVLPLLRIWRIYADSKTRLYIAGVFLLAFIGLGVRIARLAVYAQLKLDSTKYGASPSAIDVALKQYYLSILASGLELVAVNLPAIRPLFRLEVLSALFQQGKAVKSSAPTDQDSEDVNRSDSCSECSKTTLEA